MARPPPAAPAPVRLRLLFENSRLLQRVQRDEGLRRCWLLLSPELDTVADLAAHVAARFRLRRTCPRGVVLSMDGFTLPPFESTCIFRDNDIIRVKQKSCRKQDQRDGRKHQEEEAHDDHQLEENVTASHSIENNGTSSKRKWNDGVAEIPESSKGKRPKVKNSGKHIDCSKEEQRGSKKLKLSVIDIEDKKATLNHETTTTLVDQQKAEGNNKTELKCEANVADYNAQSDTKKLESRSARRKKIKRLMRQRGKLQTDKNVHEDSLIAPDFPSSSNQDGLPVPSSNQNGSHVHFSSIKADEEESDTSDEIVPVVVRPGHIRFEPAGGEPDKSPAQELQEGDLIAYRLVELSSMLCPELSSYRVGKVLVYDPVSLRIILVPVQEYPITTEEKENKDESDMLVDLSPYKEDGSLEIEYSSLVDVRLLKGIETCNEVGSAPAGRPVTLHKNEGNIESQKSPLVSNNTKGEERALGKSESTVWEKNGEPSDKVDLLQNGWATWKQNASTSAWSYRALRSSALGPTMAILRGKNSQSKPPNRKNSK
ncbi:Coilin-like isoform 1 [Zea mays]|uniref:Coilin n=2 Tax=Zea mays TaxID=4577 RepID=A0A804RHT9_MAIZE|nr:Coilin-like isoform 1 [Zea mays]|eukprot:XP_020400787.1 uncharacterized protein LOC100384247 isoform X5 [Zea mays]